MGGVIILSMSIVLLSATTCNSLTFAEKLAIWSADLSPGFKIVTEVQEDGRKCYCKVPNITTTIPPTTSTTTPPSTTTNTNPTTTTPSPPTTTTTPPSTTTPPTTTTPPSTTTTPPSTTTTPPSTTTTPPSTTTTPPSTTTTPPSTTTTPPSTTTTPPSTTTTPPSTTTTPPSTTTTPPSTTTTPPSTTTTAAAAGGPCGENCNMTIIMDDINYPDTTVTYETWLSPNYPNDYPDGCVCCLYIQFVERGFISISFNEGDSINAVDNCEFDRIDFTGSWSSLNTICDTDLSIKSNFMSKNHVDDVVEGRACFFADPGDGNTVAKGFNMTIAVQNFHNRMFPVKAAVIAYKSANGLLNDVDSELDQYNQEAQQKVYRLGDSKEAQQKDHRLGDVQESPSSVHTIDSEKKKNNNNQQK